MCWSGRPGCPEDMSCGTTGTASSCLSSAGISTEQPIANQRIRKDLGRWSRKLLLCVGLENIGKHIAGESKWDKLYDGCPSGDSGGDPDHTPVDFESSRGADKGARSSSPPHPSTPSAEAAEEKDEEERPCEQAMTEEELPDGREEEEGGDADRELEEHSVSCREETAEEDGPGTPLYQTTMDTNILSHEGSMAGDEEELEDGRVSPSTPSQGGGMDPAESPACSEPASDEKGEEGVDERGESGPGGGALVDNLLQILPYWYFFNRAFGMNNLSNSQGGGSSASGLLPSNLTSAMGVGDDQGGDEEDEDSGGTEGRLAAGSQFNAQSAQLNSSSTSSTPQRLNSILLLESLRQQFQSQGQPDLAANEDMPSIAHGFQLSELLSRMSSGGVSGVEAPWMDRKQLGSQSSLGAPTGDQEMDDQPLDLTSSTSKLSRTEGKEKGGGYTDYNRGGSTPADKQFQHSPFILDEHTSKVFRSNPRSSKGYTAQELQAALHDIQSGKLGTRRAAVIYGIPRSTLRNKVYKLGKDRGRLFSANGPAAALHNNNNNNHSSNLNNNNNNNNNNNGKGKEVSGSPLGKLGYIPGLNPSSYHHHQQQQLQRSNNVPARFTETDDEMEESPVSFVKNMRVPPSLYAINNNGDMTEGKRGELSPGRLRPIQPSLSQLISKHAHAQQRAHHHFQNAGAAGGSPMELGMDDSCQSSGGDAEGGAGPPLSHKDWKYALMRQEQLLGQQQARSGLHSANHRQPPSHSLQQQEDPATSLDLAGKKSRPKRGKYRNYDREALVKAVRAVQNGEMSVHRAGSFFGVPHSTLEYKVKERHLLRRPKRKEVTSPVSQTKSSSPESSSDATSTTRHVSSLFPKGKAAPTSSYNTTSSNTPPNNARAGLGHNYLFPLTSDLRESLSRYLSETHEEDKMKGREESGAVHSSQTMDGESNSSHPDEDIGRTDNPSGGSGPLGTLALEGLLGNRLSNLFQLNDILLRSSSSGATSGGARDNLLDLSSKK